MKTFAKLSAEAHYANQIMREKYKKYLEEPCKFCGRKVVELRRLVQDAVHSITKCENPHCAGHK